MCHANGVKFFAADVFGFYGFMFADLGQHKYVEYVLRLYQNHWDILVVPHSTSNLSTFSGKIIKFITEMLLLSGKSPRSLRQQKRKIPDQMENQRPRGRKLM